MKARLWLSLLALVPAVALGQMSLSGSWSAKVNFLPTISLDNTLTLTGEWAGWKVGGTAEYFGTDGWVWQTFAFGGAFGPAEVKGTVLFAPLAPAYIYSMGWAKIPFGGLEFTLYTAHVGANVPGYVFTGGPSGGGVAVVELSLDGPKIAVEAGFGARLTDVTFTFSGVGTYTKTFPVDPFPGGLEFTYLSVRGTALPFCCGITLDTSFSFTKAGFDSFAFTLKGIPLCCGVSFDAAVTFTTTAKSVQVRPKWAGITGCLAVYGNARYVGNVWEGIELYGFKLRCDLQDCNYLEVLTALDVARLEGLLGEDIFQGPEFEYLRVGFCGPGCCGGKYTVTLTAYFQPMGSLFGLRRIQVEAGVPVLASFTLQMALGVTVGGPANLALGWTFTF